MTNPFSEAYRKLCIENEKKLREEWEPRLGDYVIAKESKHTAIVLHSQPEQFEWGEGAPETDMVYLLFFPGVLEKMMVSGIGGSWGAPVIKYRKVDVIPLPTQRQLIEMIEARGYRPSILPRRATKWNEEDWCVPLPGCSFERWENDEELNALGPDPETALLKCLLEVMGKEK